MQPTQIKTPVYCPQCGEAVVPCHTGLDERLEHDEAIPMEFAFGVSTNGKWMRRRKPGV